jgi:hypothetical protein
MSDSTEKVGKNQVPDTLWLSIVLPVLTILVGVVLGEVQSAPKIGWGWITVATVIVFGLNWIFIWQIGRPIKNMLSELKSDLVLQQFQSQHNWLLDAQQLASYERNVPAKEIWLITSDLLDDSQGGLFMDVVRKNLQRGIRYVYFFPRTPENNSRADSIRATQKSDALKYVFLPDDFFFLVPKLDIVIYNPRADGGLSKSAFMGIPAPGESSHYHAAVSLDFIDKIVGTLLDPYQKQTAG